MDQTVSSAERSRDRLAEIDELCVRRQFAVKQQIADRQKVRILGELVDRITAIEQFALVAVDISDRASAIRRRREAPIVSEAARLLVEIADIDDVGADGP